VAETVQFPNTASTSLPSASDAKAVRSVRQLADFGFISTESAGEIAKVCDEFSLAITSDVVDLIDPSDPADPLARQFVPDPRELMTRPVELLDPIGDDPYTPIEGITHRYPDRVLLKPVHVCPVYCRFCFRREKVGVGGDGALSGAQLEAALNNIRDHRQIWEVILSGGDPLILSPRKMKSIVAALDEIGHVKIIRIHSRVPVVDPDRISDDMIESLKVKTPVYVAVHANHADEFGPKARRAVAALVDAGIPLVSQSVLLRGVNDNAEALTNLFRTLLENRIKPYYLHHGDLARGTSHFRTTIREGQELLRAVRGHISGMCQPHYVLDIPGGWGKVPIGPGYLRESPDGYIVADYQGNEHAYDDQ
jgi:lysine 2,3-aminomutase